MPGRVYTYLGCIVPEEKNYDRSLMHPNAVYVETEQWDMQFPSRCEGMGQHTMPIRVCPGPVGMAQAATRLLRVLR
jgi:hypothetical protein